MSDTPANPLARKVRRRLLAIDGVVESAGVFTEAPAFWVDGKEIAHWHGDDMLELRLTRAVISEQRARLKADRRVRLRRSSSDWLIVEFRQAEDVALVAELAELAAAAHRPPHGVPTRPPAEGADLERRRRFH